MLCFVIINLSPREAEVAQLRSQGLASKQIAAKMRLSNLTIRTYLKAVNIKFNVNNAVQLANKMREAQYSIAPTKQGLKVFARAKVSDAIYRGMLVRKPCEVCGAKKTEGHHDDYDKPLKVRWLCHAHHREQHKKKRQD